MPSGSLYILIQQSSHRNTAVDRYREKKIGNLSRLSGPKFAYSQASRSRFDIKVPFEMHVLNPPERGGGGVQSYGTLFDPLLTPRAIIQVTG